jgi:acetylornithine deacetylase/succinyl-diaminopimelate desuccinylase family protein
MTKAERLLRDLVALPSVNPAFLPPGDPLAGEGKVAEFLGATAVQAGLDVGFQKIMPGRSNLIVRLMPRRKPKKIVLLAPHLDTVTAAAYQFSPKIKNGRLYGRGACDTKGSIAAMMESICELSRAGRRPTETEIVFAGLVDEENVQAGSRGLADSGFKADLAIVGEPTRLQVVTAHKGSLWLRIETKGKSAHGSSPELGRNAVVEMARIINLLESEYSECLARRRHPLLGSATVNVGTISGGTQPNIVPDQCVISIDRRTLPGETQTSVWREIRTLLKQRGLNATCADDKLAPCDALETDPKSPFVAAFLKSIGQSQPAGVKYFCDAAVLAGAGIPSVAFGPGDIAYAHTASEWISLRSLERGQALLTRFLSSLP